MKKSKWKAYQSNQVRKQMKDKASRRLKRFDKDHLPDYMKIIK